MTPTGGWHSQRHQRINYQILTPPPLPLSLSLPTASHYADSLSLKDIDVQNLKMMTGGACGAFVHGLEDEYYEVREAAIKAICVLCLTSTKLAMKALDFLADMFNDEIDSVRYEPRSHRHLANSREPAGLAPPALLLPPSLPSRNGGGSLRAVPPH